MKLYQLKSFAAAQILAASQLNTLSSAVNSQRYEQPKAPYAEVPKDRSGFGRRFRWGMVLGSV